MRSKSDSMARLVSSPKKKKGFKNEEEMDAYLWQECEANCDKLFGNNLFLHLDDQFKSELID